MSMLVQNVEPDKYADWKAAPTNHGATMMGYLAAAVERAGLVVTIEQLGDDGSPNFVVAGPLGFFKVEWTQITEDEPKTYVID